MDKALRPDYIARTIAKAKSGRTAEQSCKLTDIGNAKRLVLRHGKNLRYCYPMKNWLVWNGVHWEVDNLGQVVEMSKETIQSIYHQTASIKNVEDRLEFAKAIRRNENHSRIKAMKDLAQSVSGIPVLPRQLDTDPWKLNVQNGTVDLMTGELLPYNRDDLITKLSPVHYVPGVRSELFEDFLERVLPDEEVRSFVQLVAGYTLYGRNEEEIMLFVYGPPASGKSTFLAAVSATLGDYAAMTDFGTFLKRERSSGGPRADVARLAGSRLVISQEVGEGAKLDEPLVNQLTGMDTVTARHLYQESFEFLPQFTIWLAANSRPQVNSPEGGIWRRIREIPFNQVIPEQERDRKLKSKLCDDPENRTGVLNWLVEGCLAWQKEGLDVPEAVREATDDYREEMDFIGQFLDDCTVRGLGYMTRNKDMRNAYTRWCRRNGFQPVGPKTFTQNLKSRGLEQVSGGDRKWKGVELVWDGYSDMQITVRRKE